MTGRPEDPWFKLWATLALLLAATLVCSEKKRDPKP